MKWLFIAVATLLIAVTLAGAAGVGHGRGMGPAPLRVASEGLPSLVLVRELGEDAPDGILASGEEEPPAVPEGIPADQRQETAGAGGPDMDASNYCYRIGPVSPSVADQLVEYLAPMSRVLERETQERREVVGYWVIEPPLGSRTQAVRRVRELKSQGIDCFVFTEGELENAISLGLFKRREAAERDLKRYEGIGLDARIVERAKSIEQAWLSVSVPGAGLGEDDQLRALLDDPGGMPADVIATGCP